MRPGDLWKPEIGMVCEVIYQNSSTTDLAKLLSDILETDNGNCVWAACTERVMPTNARK
jgi:hypothetical protein